MGLEVGKTLAHVHTLARTSVRVICMQALLNAFVLDSSRAHLWLPAAVLLRFGFYGILRHSEFTNVVRRQIVLPSQSWMGFGRQIVVAISEPKTRSYGPRMLFSMFEK